MENEGFFRIMFAVAFLVNMVIAVTYRRKAQAGEQFSYDEEGKLIYIPLRLAGLAAWLYALTYIIYPPVLEWSFVALPVWLRWVGGAVAILLVPPLIAWAQRSLGNNVTTTVITREEHQLVTDGPYKWVRHPLYTIGSIFYLALSLIAGSWFMMAVLLMTFGLIAIRTPKEEAMLIERFGDDYRAYMRRTGRFFPRLG